MDDLRKGKLLVGLQFALIAGIGLSRSEDVFGTSQVSNWVGAILLVIGFFVMALGLRGLGESATTNPVPLDKAKLVETGIFKVVRHPTYIGLTLLTLGICTSSGSVTKAIFWVLLVGLLSYKLRWEEKLLSAKYKGYSAYKQRVPAVIPRLGTLRK